MAKRARELSRLVESDPLPSDAIEQAAAALDDTDPEVRAAALDAIGRLAVFRELAVEPSLGRRIVERTTDADHRVRAEAASALAMLPAAPEGSARAVRLLLEDPHSRVRQEACAAIGDLGDQSARDFLVQRLDDVDPEVRFEAAFALGSLRDPRARETLESGLAVTRKRLDACEGLRRLGDAAAIEALEKLASKVFLPWVDRLTAWATVFVLGGAHAGAEVVSRTAARNREERAYALALIGTHRIGAGREALERAARDQRDPLRDTAVRALGELADPASVATLQAIEDGTDRQLASDAARAIARIRELTSR